MARSRGWTCQRVAKGVRCATKNDGRKRKCVKCGKHRPKKRIPEHRLALKNYTYEDYIALNGGEHCAICGRGPTNRRLDRDHDHHTCKPRGLLCARCNRALPNWITPLWLHAAAAYLTRSSTTP